MNGQMENNSYIAPCYNNDRFKDKGNSKKSFFSIKKTHTKNIVFMGGEWNNKSNLKNSAEKVSPICFNYETHSNIANWHDTKMNSIYSIC